MSGLLTPGNSHSFLTITDCWLFPTYSCRLLNSQYTSCVWFGQIEVLNTMYWSSQWRNSRLLSLHGIPSDITLYGIFRVCTSGSVIYILRYRVMSIQELRNAGHRIYQHHRKKRGTLEKWANGNSSRCPLTQLSDEVWHFYHAHRVTVNKMSPSLQLSAPSEATFPFCEDSQWNHMGDNPNSKRI